MNHQLRSLSLDPTDLDDVSVSVRALVAELSRVIPSFLGITITMVRVTGELTLTFGDPETQQPPTTSLRFSTVESGAQFRIILYANQPGALVDLDADLSYLRRPPKGGARTPTASPGRLDQDLIPAALEPRLAGLEKQAVLSRAEGVLIDRGIDPRHATSQLQQQATAAGLEPHRYARQLLQACTAGRLPEREASAAHE